MHKSLRNEQLLFLGAIAAGTIHSLDESFFSPEATPLPVVVIQTAISLVLAAYYPHMRVWRGVLAFAFGLIFAGQGIAFHLLPLLQRGPVGGDWTGALLFTPAGLVLIGLGLTVLAKRRVLAGQPAA